MSLLIVYTTAVTGPPVCLGGKQTLVVTKVTLEKLFDLFQGSNLKQFCAESTSIRQPLSIPTQMLPEIYNGSLSVALELNRISGMLKADLEAFHNTWGWWYWVPILGRTDLREDPRVSM